MQITIQQKMSAYEWGLLIALSLLWAGSFFFQAVAVGELPVMTVVTLRVLLAAVTLWVVMIVLRVEIPRAKPVWLAFVGMGILNNVIPFVLIVWGQSHIASGLASVLNAMTPIFTVLVAHFLTGDEKMSGPKIVGVLLGFAGVATMIGADVLQTFGVNLAAQLAILGATISYAFAGVFGRRFRRMGVAPMATAAGQVTTSGLLLLPVMLFLDQPWSLPAPSFSAVISIICLAVFSTALAYIIFFRIMQSAGATNLSLVTLLIPPSAILLGTLFLNEVILTKHVIGMLLIGAGLIAIDGRLFAKRVS